jgi:hypothetical protein
MVAVRTSVRSTPEWLMFWSSATPDVSPWPVDFDSSASPASSASYGAAASLSAEPTESERSLREVDVQAPQACDQIPQRVAGRVIVGQQHRGACLCVARSGAGTGVNVRLDCLDWVACRAWGGVVAESHKGGRLGQCAGQSSCGPYPGQPWRNGRLRDECLTSPTRRLQPAVDVSTPQDGSRAARPRHRSPVAARSPWGAVYFAWAA